MAGTLTVDKVTHNRISVTWRVSNASVAVSPNSLSSPPFSLITDGRVVSFSLAFNCSSSYKAIVKQNMSESGRAILTLLLDRPEAAVIMRRHLVEFWKGDYEFDCPGTSPQSIEDRWKAYSYCIIERSITLKCDITWLGFQQHCQIPRTSHSPEECLPRISYTNDLMSDVKLIVEGKELSAHKNILALHSPVFLEMFNAPMKESKENRVVIEDINFAIMETLLKIIYSGKTEDLDNVQVALQVLAVAEKYQMLTIKTACEYKLQLNVNRENVMKLLDEGDKYNVPELLELCIEYIIAARDLISPDNLAKLCLKRPNVSVALITSQMKTLCSIPSNTVRSQ